MSDETEYSLVQNYKALRVQAGEESNDVIYISVENTHEAEGTMAYGVTMGIPIEDVEFVIQMLQRAAGSVYHRMDQAQYLAPAIEGCAKMGVGLGAAFGLTRQHDRSDEGPIR